nr:TetR family transcriptional regulator C-terminal domain-containing protein [Solobacterium sp.]
LFISKNKQYFKNIMHYKNQNSLLEHIDERTHFYFLSRLKEKYGTEDLPLDLVKAVDFFCGGMDVITEDWIAGNMEESPNNVIRWLIDNIPTRLLKEIEDTESVCE